MFVWSMVLWSDVYRKYVVVYDSDWWVMVWLAQWTTIYYCTIPLYSKITFIKPKCICWSCSQEPTICACSEPNISSPTSHTFFFTTTSNNILHLNLYNPSDLISLKFSEQNRDQMNRKNCEILLTDLHTE